MKHDNIKVHINRSSPFGVKEQLKRQIRHLIENGELAPRQALPSARDLAAMLNINRNTVSFAYKELSAEGFLKVVVGEGTFVDERIKRKDTNDLNKVFIDAFAKARKLGFNENQIEDFFLTRLSSHSWTTEGCRILVVDCNKEVIDHISNTLERELSVEVESVLIQDLEADIKKACGYLKDKHLVVCGFNHIEEFKKAVPNCDVKMVAIMLKPDIRIMHEMMQIPPGTKVGYCCANQRSTETFYRSSFFSGGSSLTRILVGVDQPSKVKAMLDECDTVFVTGYIYERMQKLIKPNTRLIRVDLSIDPANIDLIREQLGSVQNRQRD